MQNYPNSVNSHCAIDIVLIYKMTEIKICVSLRKHPDGTFAAHDAAAYTWVVQKVRGHCQ